MTSEELVKTAKPIKRIFSFIFDVIVNLIVDAIFLIPSVISYINISEAPTSAHILALFISSLASGGLIIGFAIFYFVCLPVFLDGQTLGKRLLHIRIIDTRSNEAPNAKTMLLREATRILIFVLSFGLSLIASGLSLLISKKHTTFHEQLSFTKVVNVEVYSDKDINSNSNIDVETY